MTHADCGSQGGGGGVKEGWGVKGGETTTTIIISRNHNLIPVTLVRLRVLFPTLSRQE